MEDVRIPMRNVEDVADQWKKYIILNLSLSQQHLPRFTQGFSHLAAAATATTTTTTTTATTTTATTKHVLV